MSERKPTPAEKDAFLLHYEYLWPDDPSNSDWRRLKVAIEKAISLADRIKAERKSPEGEK